MREFHLTTHMQQVFLAPTVTSQELRDLLLLYISTIVLSVLQKR